MQSATALATLWLALLPAAAVRAQPDIPAAYLCERVELFQDGKVPELAWQQAPDGEVVVPPKGTCWMRLRRPADPDAFGNSEFLRFTQEQGQEISLYDGSGQLLGASLQDGTRFRAISSQTLALFPVDAQTPRLLYARLRSTNALYRLRVSVDQSSLAGLVLQAQRRDAISAGVTTFLVTAGLFAALFALLQRDMAYALFSAYALLTGLQVFGNFGVSLPFAIDTANFAFLVAEPASALMLAMIVLYLGRFSLHCRCCHFALRLMLVLSALQVAWLSLIGFGWLTPTRWSDGFYFFQYTATNLLSLAIVWGGLRAWRKGEAIGMSLALGTAPRALLWIAHSGAFGESLLGGWPPGFEFSDPAAVAGLVSLPGLFLFGIALRSREMQRDVVRLARQDLLTGLPNRDRFLQLGQRRLDRHRCCALLVLNIDRMQPINDVLGYEVGDAVTVEVGRRLSSVANALVARTQSNEFGLLWPQPERLAELRREIESAFADPISVLGQSLDISLSVGVAQPGGEPMALMMRNAEIALGVARSRHQGWVSYEPEMDKSRPENLSLLSELNAALEHSQVLLFLQPKVRLSDGCVHSAEALVRWRHPVRGLMAPNDFVPFAEQTGRISALTLWVLRQSARLTSAWRRDGICIVVSVNISTHDLRDASLVDSVCQIVASEGALAEDLRLEVTESGIMDDPQAALAVLLALRRQGFSLSIDDFGTGYSSLAYLQKLPAAELKIDRSFVSDVAPGSEAAALLDSIIALGHRMGLSVVAEGAETAQEWALLKGLGCDYVQGWFAAKAMPAAEFLAWRDAHAPFLPA